MDELLDALAAQHAELAQLIDVCGPDDWERPTRCEGWDVAAVLLHLAQTDEMAVASARGDLDNYGNGFIADDDGRRRVTVDAAAAAPVDVERAAGDDAIRTRWHAAADALQAELAAGDPHRRVTWVSGKLSLQTLAATRLSEGWIHTGDIAAALGAELEPTDRLRHIARLAWRTLPYAFAQDGLTMHGPVALDLVAPSGEHWRFDPDEFATTTIEGSAADFCAVAARRVEPDATGLVGRGPDAANVLRLVRTYAL